jgi:hypothetical protein
MAAYTFSNGDQRTAIRAGLNGNAALIDTNTANVLALTPASVIVVNSASDLSGTLVSDKVYLIDGIIDMGTQTITVPSTGLQIAGYGIGVSKLLSTENSYTMFVDAASDAGTLFISELTIDVSGTSSQVFDLDNSGAGDAVEINSTNFENCTSIGTLDAFRQFLMVNVFWLSCDDGITFAGTWAGGASIRTFLVRNFDPGAAGGTVFTGSTSPALTFASRFFCDGNIDTPSGATVYDFAASMFTNDADFELITGQYTGAGTVVAVKSPVVDNTSTKSRHRDNNGIPNTYVGARWSVTTETATTVSSSSTYYKLAGTTTYDDEQWFSNTTDNAFVLDSTNTIEVVVQGTISVQAGNNDELQVKIRMWDDSASAYVDIHEHGTITMSGSGKGENKALLGFATMEINDRIEVWIQNIADTTNITMLEGSLVSVSERAN